MKKDHKIVVISNGPYKVSTSLPLTKEIAITDCDNIPYQWKRGKVFPLSEVYLLCRCGKSKNKPFCDGTHAKINFDGTETASRKDYLELAEKIIGPGVDLTDVKELCSSARFCNRAGGTWSLTRNSDNPESQAIAIQETCDCPSGRLVAWNKKTGDPIEPDFEPSISLIEDPDLGVSGPDRKSVV